MADGVFMSVIGLYWKGEYQYMLRSMNGTSLTPSLSRMSGIGKQKLVSFSEDSMMCTGTSRGMYSFTDARSVPSNSVFEPCIELD